MDRGEFEDLLADNPVLGEVRARLGADAAPWRNAAVERLQVEAWRAGAVGRPGPTTGLCPVCLEKTYRGAATQRTPDAVCGRCSDWTVCLAHGRPVRLYERGLVVNGVPAGGARHRGADGRDAEPCEETDGGVVSILDTVYAWSEGYFGGTVIHPWHVPASGLVHVGRSQVHAGDLADLEGDVPVVGSTLAALEEPFLGSAVALAVTGATWVVRDLNRWGRALGVYDVPEAGGRGLLHRRHARLSWVGKSTDVVSDRLWLEFLGGQQDVAATLDLARTYPVGMASYRLSRR